MIWQKLKCAQTEFHLPLASRGITFVDASFFYSLVLLKTSKCLYPKLIHIFQIWVTDEMPFVAVPTLALDYPRPSHWGLGFSKQRSPLQAGDQGHCPDGTRTAFPGHQQKPSDGNKHTMTMRASEGHTSAGERERGRMHRSLRTWAPPVPGSGWGPSCGVWSPGEHVVTSLIPLTGIWKNQETCSRKVSSNPCLGKLVSFPPLYWRFSEHPRA